MKIGAIELQELRKGLRKRKLPQISKEMFGDASEIGMFHVDWVDNDFRIEWQLFGSNNSIEKKNYSFSDLSYLPELEYERYELGNLMSTIYSEHGQEIRNSIPGPREAMMESNPYFVEAEKWEHWAKVSPGFFLK